MEVRHDFRAFLFEHSLEHLRSEIKQHCENHKVEHQQHAEHCVSNEANFIFVLGSEETKEGNNDHCHSSEDQHLWQVLWLGL